MMGEKPVETQQKSAARGATATTISLHYIVMKKLSPREQKYLKAIAMSSARWGQRRGSTRREAALGRGWPSRTACHGEKMYSGTKIFRKTEY
jgi:hypothetical protein